MATTRVGFWTIWHCIMGQEVVCWFQCWKNSFCFIWAVPWRKIIFEDAGTVFFLCFIKFLSAEIAFYLYESIVWSYMEYCSHFWTGAPCCYLDMLDKLQKWVSRTFNPSVCSLAHHRKIKPGWYFFGRCSSWTGFIIVRSYKGICVSFLSLHS